MASFGDLNRVNTNIQAMDAQFSLNQINKNLAENQLKMSTGLRINRAEDDSAGYSIASKLRSRIGGLNTAMQNVGDAKSVLDITEASFDTVIDSLIEMKSLATQAANDTLGDVERGFIAKQIEELGKNINEVAAQTVYQDYDLLSGSVVGGTAQNTGSLILKFQVGERTEDVMEANILAVNVGTLFTDGTDRDLGTAGNATSIQVTAAVAGTAAGAQGEITFDTTGGVLQATVDDFNNFIGEIDSAIDAMSERVNAIGINQSSLSVREETLAQAISANESARSRIMDTDFAKAQSESIRLQILQQTATSALAQANMGPQSVLSFLG